MKLTFLKKKWGSLKDTREDSKLITLFNGLKGTAFAQMSFISPSKCTRRPGSEVIKLFSCSTQLSMTFFLLINVEMPTVVGIRFL